MALGSTYEKANKKLSGSQTNALLCAGVKLQIGVKCIFPVEHAHHTMVSDMQKITCVIPPSGQSVFPGLCPKPSPFGRRKLWISKATLRETALTLGKSPAGSRTVTCSPGRAAMAQGPFSTPHPGGGC